MDWRVSWQRELQGQKQIYGNVKITLNFQTESGFTPRKCRNCPRAGTPSTGEVKQEWLDKVWV